MKKLPAVILLLSVLLVSFAGCAAAKKESSYKDEMNQAGEPFWGGNQNASAQNPGAENGEYEGGNETQGFAENPFISTLEEPVSTFSADVDTASYTYFRKLVNSGQYDLERLQMLHTGFRTEEFLNYFRYQANQPQNGELFGVTTSIAPCPWSTRTVLMRLTLQAEEAIPEAGNNLVFLIDVSGSMSSSDKLPLLKKAFHSLVRRLTENDVVSIVTYSGKEAVILQGCPGNQREKIMNAINKLTASGVTNGQAGLRTAYRIAEENMIENGNNRIIMASDGDLNVGISSPSELKEFVEGKRNQGVYLSVLGFGTGNYRDGNMEALADNGNGNYYYIDGESEAERIFGTALLSTLYTVANDVKLQITFDENFISAYRLIGYENRLLDKDDFDDDTKDAGEVGAGHQVTVFYELEPTAAAPESDGEGDWMVLAVRYKRPGETASQRNEYGIGFSSYTEGPDDELRFMEAVIETAMILHSSKYLKDIDISHILGILDSLDLSSAPDRAEFRNLVRTLG